MDPARFATTPDNIEIAQTAKMWLTWQDISFWLWGAILTIAAGLFKFTKWFFYREVARFRQDVEQCIEENSRRLEQKQQQTTNELNDAVHSTQVKLDRLQLDMDQKFQQQHNDIISLTNSLNNIQTGVDKVRGHYHNKQANDVSVLQDMIHDTVALAIKDALQVSLKGSQTSKDSTR